MLYLRACTYGIAWRDIPSSEEKYVPVSYGRLDVRLAVYSEIKKYVYIPHMDEKMAAFKYIVQCYKCNCLVIKENRQKTVIFRTTKPAIMPKTCHYLDNLDNVPKL